MRFFELFIFVLILFNIKHLLADDWPQFRGKMNNGISQEKNVLTTWSETKNMLWKVKLPDSANNSSPIVSKDSIFLSISSRDGTKRSLNCYDIKTGEEKWVRSVQFNGNERTHSTSRYGGSTPVADGERVVVWHSSAGMHCYDYEGNLLWSTDLGDFNHIFGYGASPIIYKNLVINNCGPGESTFLVALDKHTGEIVWKTNEAIPTESIDALNVLSFNEMGSWSTPVISKINGQDEILMSYPYRVISYSPTSGKVLWTCDGISQLVYTSVLIGDGLGVAMAGRKGSAMAFKLGGTGDVTDTNTIWKHKGRIQRIGSGIILNDFLYVPNERGRMECINVKTGEQVWDERLPVRGSIWSSLVYANGNLYTTTKNGTTVVFSANPDQFKVISVNEVDGTTNSTIAISNGEVFQRNFDALYCFKEE